MFPLVVLPKYKKDLEINCTQSKMCQQKGLSKGDLQLQDLFKNLMKDYNWDLQKNKIK